MSILLGILVGLALPVQTSVNNKLRDKVGTPYNSSLVSFIISTVFLACLLLVMGQGFHLPMDQLAGEPFWVWLGGLCGVVFLTANVILLTKLGSAETVILPVLGQLLMGLLVDSLGLFRAQQIPLTPLRAGGAVLVLAGVMVVAWSGQAAAAQGQRPAGRLWLWRIVGVAAGMFSATQTAINGHLGQVVGSPLTASMVSFLVGLAALVVLCAVLRVKQGPPTLGQGRFPWWTWTGGLLGAVYVLANIYLSGILGTGMTVIILLVGATAGGAVIDHFGLLGAAQKSLTVRKVVGILGMLAGAAAIKLFWFPAGFLHPRPLTGRGRAPYNRRQENAPGSAGGRREGDAPCTTPSWKPSSPWPRPAASTRLRRSSTSPPRR